MVSTSSCRTLTAERRGSLEEADGGVEVRADCALAARDRMLGSGAIEDATLRRSCAEETDEDDVRCPPCKGERFDSGAPWPEDRLTRFSEESFAGMCGTKDGFDICRSGCARGSDPPLSASWSSWFVEGAWMGRLAYSLLLRGNASRCATLGDGAWSGNVARTDWNPRLLLFGDDGFGLVPMKAARGE